MNVNVLLQDKTIVQKDVNDALILAMGRLREFYLNNSSPESMYVVY